MALRAIATATAEGSSAGHLRSNLPPGFEHLTNKYGWQIDGNAQVLMVREPVTFRVHEDREFDLRTTWVRTLLDWTRVEQRI